MFSLQASSTALDLGLLKTILNDFIEVAPRILMAIAILIVGWIVAKIIASVIRRLLKSLKVDRLGQRLEEIEVVQKSGIEISISGFISKLTYYLIFFAFLIVSVEKLGVDAITAIMTDMIAFIPKLLSALALLIFGMILSDMLRGLLETSLKSLNIPSALLISKAIFYFLLVNVFVVAMAQSGIDMDFLSSNITVLIGGVAMAFAISYGLASKTLASNTISSFYAKDDIEIGDLITLGDVQGKVISVGNRNITLQAEDGKVIVPFKRLMEETIIVHND